MPAKSNKDEISDVVKKALKDVKAMPKIQQILIGTGSGLATGYVVTKVGKAAAIIVGTGLIGLQVAQHFGYVNINWKKVKDDLNKQKVKTIKSIEHSSTDSDRLVSDIKSFITENMTFVASFTVASKRGKTKNCANPVFEQWIIELRDDAIAKELQSKHTYTKCLNSLRKYPLPLFSGVECAILEGFGDKICQLIDKKLQKFLKEGGKLHPDDDVQPLSETENIEKSNETRSILKRKAVAKDKSDKYVSQSTTSKPAKEDEDVECISNEKSPKVKRKTNNRDYMPEFRSGGYALLLTLLNNEIEQDGSSMLKSELIKDAQKHCDASFSVSEANNHYTAWSSMSSLIKKGLVEKSNNLPARYSLTETGRESSLKLLEKNSDNSSKQSDLTDKTYKQSQSQSQASSYMDIDKSSQGSKARRVESIELDDDNYNYTYKDNDYGGNCGVGSDDDYNEIISIANANKPKKQSPKISNSQPKSIFNSNKSQQTSNKKHIPNEIVIDNSDSECNDIEVLPDLKSTSVPFSTTQVQKTVLNDDKKPKLSDIITTFLPGSYEIILLVDTCETSHAKRQELFLKELNKTDIKYEIQKLNIGDFVWIARSKSMNEFQRVDIVLDCIVERKRVDDLCQSIIDGRYKEQKFRLKRSGIHNIIYLIEEFGSMKNFNLPESTIKQAIINTQIIDGFLVKQTTDVKDSVLYLTELTKSLIDFHKSLTLHACLKEKIDEYYGKYWAKIEREKPHNYLLTFNEFYENTNKNKPPTVKQMFGRFLIQINGCTEDKCLAILEKYPTLAHLYKAYAQCESDDAKMKLLANIKYGKQNRNIGPALSKTIASLFTSKTPLK